MKKQLEEGQVVLCKVTKIVGTIVFVNIEDYNLEGTIIFSEISPGRIRNIRDYAFPGKKIACKVLKIKPGAIHLSLRRVKLKERTELNESIKREKSFKALLKTVLEDKEKATQTIEKINQDQESLADFIEEAREDSSLLEKYINKTNAEKVAKILQEKKSKETSIQKRFSLTSKESNGLTLIKEIIKKAIEKAELENYEVSYIAAGKYLIKIKTKNLKQADQKLEIVEDTLEELSKKEKCSFNKIKN